VALHSRIEPVDIAHEMRQSFLDYAMSVIVSRALPDVRDGLKPVQRRILYDMLEEGLTPDKPYRKSATIVGTVLARYHPHGDAAVYETLVRMVQPFSYRYPLVDGQGNFGSVDGDSAAAMRYTEARLSPLALELLRDIHKDTVDFRDNFDASRKEPVVLPARFPNLIVNGSQGIAVGMATNIPPHNLGEAIDAVLLLMERPDASLAEILERLPGPDFPTGGVILGREGIRKAYETGRGKIRIRAQAEIERISGERSRIVFTEIPYQVNKAKVVERIAELVRDKVLDGVTDVRDESSKGKIRVVVEVRKGADPRVILNQIYRHTAFQTSFGIIFLALVDGRPEILGIRELLLHYIAHQREVVRRRTAHDLEKAEARLHIVEGLMRAVDLVDVLVHRYGPIRSARDRKEARANLCAPTFVLEGRTYEMGFTEAQADAILDMRLEQLTGLSIEKLADEESALRRTISDLRAILESPARLDEVVRKELLDVREKFADERRTRILDEDGSFEATDLIADEPFVVTLSEGGYLRRTDPSTYRAQRRGGKGVLGVRVREDVIVHVVHANAHDTLLFFTNRGRVYPLLVHEIPEQGRTTRGSHLANFLPLAPEERVTALLPYRASEPGDLVFATRLGFVKRTPAEEFRSLRRSGLVALSLERGDELVGVQKLGTGQEDVLLVTQGGKAIRFPVRDVREMGRQARGVRGIRLKAEDFVVALESVRDGDELLFATELGYGKRTPAAEFRPQSRGGQGIRAVSRQAGSLVAAVVVREDDDFLLVTRQGQVIRMPVREVPVLGRTARGVRLVRLEEGDALQTLARIPAED